MSSLAPTSAPSAFSCALDEYIKSRPAKSKTPQFIQTLQEQQRAGQTLDGAVIKREIVQLERNATDRKAAQVARKVLKPVVDMLSAYTGVIDTLVQADPMPTAIVWGTLRAVIQSSSRFLKLYEVISDQIEALRTHIDTLTGYEELFGDSLAMRELLEASYIGIFRFWRRVEKECNRSVANRMLRAVGPFSTAKLDEIIGSIGKTADDMSRLIPIVKERVDRNERENAAEERRLAGIAREDQKLLFQMYEEDLRKRNEERKQQRQKDVRDWLRSGDVLLNESNFRHQDYKQRARSPGTCEWLLDNETWKNWVDIKSPASQLSVRAAPGVGKSVLAAYAVESLPQLSLHGSAVIFQYFTFDDEFPALLVYRCLAEQLANRLGKHTGDMPEDIHCFTQLGATSARSEDVKTVIRMLVERLPATYVVLDGLDEMCESQPRQQELCDVVDFLQELASTRPDSLRLWMSSQSRTCLDSRLNSMPSIEVTKEVNSLDIEKYLSRSIVDLDSLDLDEGYKNLILQELRDKADGCFLWASLMLQSMSNAITLQMVQQLIDNGLPQNYERYYQRKMDSIEPSVKGFVSVLLACIVHAKRPLRLEELCECIAMARGHEGQDLNMREKLVKSRVLQLCQPLVQVHEGNHGGETVSTCTLTHRSVKSFLLKNPGILKQGTADSDACTLENKVMADICLRYLLQPRYSQLLRKTADTYVDTRGGDIMEHHLLSYSAKYWDKHMDSVTVSPSLCQSVSTLLNNSQFFTLLQVQSLFIEGQFTYWLNALRPWAGKHFRRVFPHWLDDNCTDAFTSNYGSFVGEWGYLLNEQTRLERAFEGEIDRCLFGALGSDNFLHKGPSRYKSLKFSQHASADSEANRAPTRCFDAIDETETRLRVVKLEALSTDKVEFRCEHWSLDGKQNMEFQGAQTLHISPSTWPLYEYPLKEKVFGRPDFVSFTSDLRFMRMGSHLFVESDNYEYKLLPISEEYFEGMASIGKFLAVTTRRPVTKGDIEIPEQAVDDQPVDYADIMLRKLKAEMESLDEKAAERAAAAATEESTRPTTTATSETDDSDEASSVTSASSVASNNPSDIDVESTADQKSWAATSETGITDKLLFQPSSESAGNSAYTSWSEGSTDLMSNELEGEDDQWNDWDYQKLHPEEIDVEERGSMNSDDESPFDGDVDVESHLSESDNDGDDIMGVREESVYEYSGDAERDSDSDSSNNSKSGGGVYLEAMLGKGSTRIEGSRRTSIRVYDSTRPESVPVFHYTGFVKGALFESPPVFHPTKPLLVWPLGDADILFANYQANTYFTRQLCRSKYNSCHVFVKAHFSSDEYLHFAALEASEIKGAEGTNEEPRVQLSLQASTHRLSSRKTASSPPRLVFRTTVELGTASSIAVSNLPFFVTWTDKELFFLNRQRKLDITRIPLFRPPPAPQNSDSGSDPKICCLRDPIFLPRSIESRKMHFVPAPQKSSESSATGKKKNKRFASLILGAYCSSPSRGILVPKNLCDPPIAVFLREDRDLVWTCKEASGEVAEIAFVNAGCGRLKGKFESFDRNEDCDIVPYFF
ncbi:hypothetical protein BJX68DRAFT_266332 [Aspergillus pseudodeflectus]|uniref:NACHT domain-containing protein n=1 Tax=Aspergillus pseudodeflectus TaxID=176178 RepID=A0ABR4KGM1_9EURO